MREHTFHEIDGVIDEVHGLFDGWVRESASAANGERYGLLVMKLAVHEWIANLVQHASFKVQPPYIRLVISLNDAGLHCLIEDNSEGFDFHAQIEEQSRRLSDPVPSERGRGLLMMLACAEDLVYEARGNGVQHLQFVVNPPVDSDNMPSFFPAVNRASDQA